MRLGVLILPEDSWPVAPEKWRRVEQLGFDHAWTYDHLAWRSLRDEPWFAAVPTLAAAAALTSRIRLGVLVASANFRHPVPFARELVTIDHIAGGRLTVGLGAGGLGWDTTVLGQPMWSPEERVARFAEFVALLDELLRHVETTAMGKFWQAVEARMYPGCVQAPRVPFAIAATGRRSMGVAAQHASIWVTNGDRSHTGAPLGPEEGAAVVAQQLTRFEEICATVGRDPAEIDRLVLTGPRLDPGLGSASQFAEVAAAYEAVGATDLVIHYPRPTEPYAGPESVLEFVAEHATTAPEQLPIVQAT